MVTPAAASLFFLPQKPYMPLGSLRSQLLFPSGRSLPHRLPLCLQLCVRSESPCCIAWKLHMAVGF